LVFISHCYHESPRGELFFETQCSRLAEVSFIVRMLYKDIIILVTHFFTILSLRSLDCFICRPVTLYRCNFVFCQSALNKYEWIYAQHVELWISSHTAE